jgi:tetratricopeptide (TPR) repeat protein
MRILFAHYRRLADDREDRVLSSRKFCREITMSRITPLSFALLMLAILAAPAAKAFNFAVRADEWDTWPPECRARYSTTKASNVTPYAGVVPSSEVQAWQSRVGAYAWNHMHHYCAGLAYMHRAARERDPKWRDVYLKNAAREAGYTYNRLLQQPPQVLFPDVSIGLAAISMESGQPSKAMKYLELAVQEYPRVERIYLAMASVHQSEGRPEQARETLLRGQAATGGGSAELIYNLGLVSYELGDLDAAVKYAGEAYGAGFPLPGLRRKLESSGRVVGD